MIKKNLPTINVIIIFIIFSLGYFLSTLLIAVPATISPFLISEFNFSASELGLLGGAYFAGFALMQLPLGYLLDIYGPKLILSIFLIFAVIGVLLFCSANEFKYLFLGRFFIGMLASTIPVYYLISIYSWRIVFLGIAILILICILLIITNIPSWNNINIQNKEFYSLSLIWKNEYFQSLVPIALFNVAGFYSMITLWVGPWMNKVSGYGAEKTAISLFLINLLLIIAYLIWGYLSPKILNKGININQVLTRGIPLTLIFLLLIIIFGKN